MSSFNRDSHLPADAPIRLTAEDYGKMRITLGILAATMLVAIGVIVLLLAQRGCVGG
jgi:hypothetical protein